jgi:DNA-binding LacI/PurR family transcriptional regulator
MPTAIRVRRLRALKKIPIATFDHDRRQPESNGRYTADQPIEQIGTAAVQIFMQAKEKKDTEPVVKILSADIRSL